MIVIGAPPRVGDVARLDRACVARLGADRATPVTGRLRVSGVRAGHGGWIYLTGHLITACAPIGIGQPEPEIEVLVWVGGLAVERHNFS